MKKNDVVFTVSSLALRRLVMAMVLLGALIQTGIIPLSAKNVLTAIQTRTKKAFVDINRTAFELGYSAASR